MDKRNYRDMWVYIEINEGKIHHVGLELCSEVRRLCDQSGERLIAVVAGEVSEDELDKVRDSGVDGIIRVTGTGYERYNTEAYTNLFTELCFKYRPSAVFVGGTTNGRDFAPRFAARLETGCTSDATELIYNPETTDIEFVEPAARWQDNGCNNDTGAAAAGGVRSRPGTFKYSPSGRRPEIEELPGGDKLSGG